MYPDPLSTLLWAIGEIAKDTCGYALIIFPFLFAFLWGLKHLLLIISPVPKSANDYREIIANLERYRSITPLGTYDFVCSVCGHKSKTDNKSLTVCSERCRKIAYARRRRKRMFGDIKSKVFSIFGKGARS